MDKKYPVVKLIKTYEDTSPVYEDAVVKEMMLKHGINNVRGGSYSQLFIPKYQYVMLHREMRGALNQCFRCGGDHFVKECPRSYKQQPDDTISNVIVSGIKWVFGW